MNRLVSVAIAGIWLATPAFAGYAKDSADSLEELSRMSLEQLANVDVTSVSKAAQSLTSAPASIYVITHEEIQRAGVLSIPEALRLAPNLQVTQINSRDYQIGARGLAGNLEAQNFSNKILILIDGRSVYNPLFSGVTYDALDVVMDDVDRIEVISGPGATLWGANAMNGVINIITRTALDTQGALVRATVGRQESALSARYGGRLSSEGAFRVYAKGFDRGPSEIDSGAPAGDRWNKVQGGFRVDSGGNLNRFTVQGDYQQASLNVGAAPDADFSQGNLLGRWDRAGSRATSHLQMFIDHADRKRPPQGVGFRLDTYDLDFQQSLQLGARQRMVWGLGKRFNVYDIDNAAGLSFVPASRTLDLTNVFAQDSIALGHQFTLIAGIKFEENSYSGWSTLPDLRLSWAPNDSSLIWAAAARAIRSPTPFDVDVEERAGPVLFVTGDPQFRTEKVTAYEIGYRAQPLAKVSWSLSAFYNDYEDLRSIEPTIPTFLPLHWGNLIEGGTYGVEVWANLQLAPWWRLSPGFRSLHKRLKFSEGAIPLLGVDQTGNDPHSQASLKSSMAFGSLSFDAMLRYVADLPDPRAPDYTELNARVAYSLGEQLDLAVAGFNLLDDRHREYTAGQSNEIRRSVQVEIRWVF